MKNLVIITPCSRPNNLEKLKYSIDKLKRSLKNKVHIDWLIVYDSDIIETRYAMFDYISEYATEGGIAGKMQINLGLDELFDDDLVYILDDDNIIHPNFKNLFNIKTDKLGFIFGQDLLGENYRVPLNDNIKVGKIDQAQFVLSMQLIKDKRYIQKYEADGYFIEEIYKEHSDKILIIPEIMSYYNKLR